jgi:hypothetical protein
MRAMEEYFEQDEDLKKLREDDYIGFLKKMQPIWIAEYKRGR